MTSSSKYLEIEHCHAVCDELRLELAKVKQQRDALASEVDEANERVAEVTAERDQWKDAYENLMSSEKLIIDKSNLAEILAETAKQAIYALFEIGNCPQYENGAGDGYIECGDALEFAEKCAAKVRQGGA